MNKDQPDQRPRYPSRMTHPPSKSYQDEFRKRLKEWELRQEARHQKQKRKTKLIAWLTLGIITAAVVAILLITPYPSVKRVIAHTIATHHTTH